MIIWFCFYVFIVVGFEYFVVNMIVFLVFLLFEYFDKIILMGVLCNLVYVLVGNVVVGVGIMGIGYWVVVGCLKGEVV